MPASPGQEAKGSAKRMGAFMFNEKEIPKFVKHIIKIVNLLGLDAKEDLDISSTSSFNESVINMALQKVESEAVGINQQLPELMKNQIPILDALGLSPFQIDFSLAEAQAVLDEIPHVIPPY